MSLSKKSNELLTDPMLQQIKLLSRLDLEDRNTLNSDSYFMERTRTIEAKFSSLLLDEEWLEISDTYLRLPPTLSDDGFLNIFQELDEYHIRPIRPFTQQRQRQEDREGQGQGERPGQRKGQGNQMKDRNSER